MSNSFLSRHQQRCCCCCCWSSILLLLCIGLVRIEVSESKFVDVGARPVYVPKLPKSKRYSFSWQAYVDASSGVALSKEKMQASPDSAINRHFAERQQQQNSALEYYGNHENGSGSDSVVVDVWRDIIDRLEAYPQWVVRGAITFGLLRAVPVSGGCYSLRDRLFGINLLTFGRPQSQRFSFHPQQQQPPRSPPPPPPPPRNGTTTGTATGISTGGIRYNEICTVTIPIVGGLLALSKSGNDNHGYRGCLKFTLKHNAVLGETQLVTEIRDYVPLLLGTKEPVPFYRKCLYLSTQSIVHAYVMWRFQRYCIHTSYNRHNEHQPQHFPQDFDKTLAAVEGFASYSSSASPPPPSSESSSYDDR